MEGEANLITTNNFPAGMTFAHILIRGGFNSPTVEFSGQPITLSEALESSASFIGMVEWAIDIALDEDVLFLNTGGTPFNMKGNVDLNSRTATFRTSHMSSNAFSYGGIIHGTGTVVKDDRGTVRFDGPHSNRFDGPTYVNNGVLVLARSGMTALTGNVTVGDGTHEARLAANGQLASTSSVTVNPNGTYSAGTDTIESLSLFGGEVTSTNLAVNGNILSQTDMSIPGILTFGGSAGTTHSIQVAAGTVLTLAETGQNTRVSLRKAGAGKLVLNGVADVSEVVLAEGELEVRSASDGLAVVLDGDDTIFSGGGSVGSVTSLAGGRIHPGDDAPGVLKTGSLNLKPDVTVVARIAGPAPGAEHDQLQVDGPVSLSGATLEWSIDFLPVTGQEFVLVSNDGADPIGGAFAGLPEGHEVTVSGNVRGRFTYSGGDGNDFSMQILAVPPTGVTRVWEGNSPDGNNWSDPLNWEGDVAAAPGDALLFPDTAERRVAINDFTPGSTFASIAISGDTGSGYRIRGNRVVLLDGLQYIRSGIPSEIETPITLGGDQVFLFEGDSGFTFTSDAAVDMGEHELIVENNLLLGTSSKDWLNVYSVFSGQGGIRIEGGGDTRFYETHIYVGETWLRGGRLRGQVPAGLRVGGGDSPARFSGSNGFVPETADLIVLANGTFELNGSTIWDAVGGLLMDGGTISLLNNAELRVIGEISVSGQAQSDIVGGRLGLAGPAESVHTLHIEEAATLWLHTTVRSVTEGATLNKTGPGRALFTGNNTLAGITLAEGEGVFQTIPFGGSSMNVPITLAGGILGGDSFVGEVIGTAAGGAISPGLSTGVLKTKDLSLAEASGILIELESATPGDGHDQIQVTGVVDLGGAELVLSELPGYVAPVGSVLVIIENDGGDPVVGSFGGIPEGGEVVVGANTYIVSYVGGDGNDVTLTVASAPTGITRTWSGFGPNNLWSTPDNWTGGIIPSAGDSVEFPEGSFRLSNQNDLPEGTVLNEILITGASSYSLSGNALNLLGGITLSGSAAVSHDITFGITVGSDQTFATHPEGRLVLFGHGLILKQAELTLASENPDIGILLSRSITGEGTVAIDGGGATQFSGFNSWTGDVIVRRGVLELNAGAGICVPGDLVIGGHGALAAVLQRRGPNISSASHVEVREHGSWTLDPQISETVLHLTIARGTVHNQGYWLTVNGDLHLLGGDLTGSSTTRSWGKVTASGALISNIDTTLALHDPIGAEHVLEVAGGSELNLNGVVVSDSNGTSFRKTGEGIVLFNAPDNSLERLALEAGTARFVAASPSVPVFLDGGRLDGDGGTGAIISTARGGTVAPGTSPGSFTSGNLFWNEATVFEVEIGGTTPGVDHDQLQVAGGVNLGNAQLQLLLFDEYLPAGGQWLTILENDGADEIVGVFAGLPEGSGVMAGNQEFTITYVGGEGGNDVVLTAVAPPALPQFVDFWVTPSSGPGMETIVSALVSGGSPDSFIELRASFEFVEWITIATVQLDGAGSGSFIDVPVPGSGDTEERRNRSFFGLRFQ